MITLKKWNELSLEKRRKIAGFIFDNMPHDFVADVAERATRKTKWLEIILDHCRLNKDTGQITVKKELII